jgi:hypothetical protein
MQFENKRMYKVLTPITKKDGGTFWMRIGSGFPAKDGALNILLDALPTATSDGKTKLYIREMDERDFERRGGDAPRTDGPRADRRNQPSLGSTDNVPF